MLTLEQILDGNRIIAEFMGEKVFYPDYIKCYQHQIKLEIPKNHQTGKKYSTYSYHSLPPFEKSYDWLMPVVDTIEALDRCAYGFTKNPWGIKVIEYKSGNEVAIVDLQKDGESNIELYWLAVVEFCTWYKTQEQVKLSQKQKPKQHNFTRNGLQGMRK